MAKNSTNNSDGQTLLQRYASLLASSRAETYVNIAQEQRAKLQQLDLLMKSIVEQSFDGIMAFDEQGFVRITNDAACQLFRGSRKTIVGKHLKTLLPDFGTFRRSIHADPAKSEDCGDRLEGLACRLDKTTCSVEIALRKISIGREKWLMAILRDITAAKAYEEKLRHLALHDTLTGLPNRLLLKDRLDQALRAAKRSDQPITLAILDLDRFKEINDTLGHQVGDALLVDVAKRLIGCVRDGDTVARLGGDEFAILLPHLNHGCSTSDIANRVVASIHEPFSIAGCIALEVGVSIGLAVFPEDADSEGKLMQCADVAMYDAKRNTTAIERYDPAKDINSVRMLVLSGGLRRAIDDGQLSLVFQPKLDLRTCKIKSFEVLTRWDHPDHGAISPREFVPQAEQSGNIIPFTRWTLEQTLAHLTAWREADFDISLALNLSPRSLHSKQILAFMEDLIRESQLSPDQLTLELTETAVMLDPDSARASLKKLHELGLRLSIDDFGTGYSSLSLLRQLPLNEIKIDKSFIENMVSNAQDQVIVSSTINLAHNLGLDVVAEGVESEAQMALLQDLGCDLIQGFLIAKPIPADALADWTKQAPWPLGKLCDAA